MSHAPVQRRTGWSPAIAPLPPASRDVRKLLTPTAAPVRGRSHRPQKGFEAYADADAERRYRVDELRSHPTPDAASLSRLLDGCIRNHRCRSSACPCCVGLSRIWLVGEMLALWPDARSWKRLSLVTLVLPQWRVPSLQTFCPARLKHHVRYLLRAAGAKEVIMVGAVDGEYDAARGYWQPHLHCIAEGLTVEMTKRLRHLCRTDRSLVYRPLVVSPVTDAPRQFSYVFKSYWPEKVRFRTEGKKETDRRRLSDGRHVEWLTKIHQTPIQSLWFHHGVRRYRHGLMRTRAQ